MFQNEECDASVGKVASAFILGGILNSYSADVVLYCLREKCRGTDKLIVPRWVTWSIACLSFTFGLIVFSVLRHV